MTLFHSHNYFDLTDINDEAATQGQEGSNNFSATNTTTTPISGSAVTQTLYLQEAGDTSKVSVNDLHQGAQRRACGERIDHHRPQTEVAPENWTGC